MAYTRNTFIIYDDQFQTGLEESVAQNLALFNGSSKGAIVLKSEALQGDYSQGAMMLLPTDGDNHRDPNSVAAVSDIDLVQGELVSVNICRRQGPFAKTLDAWAQIEADPGALSILVGTWLGQLKAQQMVKSSISALVNALLTQSSLTFDATAETTKTLTTQNLAKGFAKMGDRAESITCLVMHSLDYYNLVDNQLGDKMDTIAGLIAYGGNAATLGRTVIVTDESSLITAVSGETTVRYILGLQSSAAVIKDSAQSPLEYEVELAKANLIGRIQGEYTMQLGLRGMAWDMTGGGANPNDAAIATGSNWTKVASSVKDLPGFVIKVN
jgi:hypothetical protein